MHTIVAHTLAAGFQVKGFKGVSDLIALILFLIAAIVAYFVTPIHRLVFSLIAAGLFFVTLAFLVTG